ncbi:MAG: cob(I)yrinic acid a,c-diamide adenosyltransferase [Chitinivibrionales bacterium]|nr:cob(I)yrinic acid a,c-diamide adenosyltransferase [Chitinivibrionales bacterium]
MKRGYVQVYTGNGKGKTTAALGCAIRAAGAGLNVLVAQFVKGAKYNEIRALERFSNNVTVRQYGRTCFIKRRPEQKDIDDARRGLQDVRECLNSGLYDVVVLDEANIALYYSLFTVRELLEIIDNRPQHCEIIITGRYAPKEILDVADLVTEMKEVKHYYSKGVNARDGIER